MSGSTATRSSQFDAAHIGIAVDTERGLLAPVLRDADRKSIHDIAAESADLIERTRDGSIGGDQLKGSTFTVSNLGMFEIDAFTPILNLPEAAILGVGRIVPKPVVIDVERRDDCDPADALSEPDLRSPRGRWRSGGAVPATDQADGRAAAGGVDAVGPPNVGRALAGQDWRPSLR